MQKANAIIIQKVRDKAVAFFGFSFFGYFMT